MEVFGALVHGFAIALSPPNLLLMLAGVVLGVVVGVLPALGGAGGIAMLLALTIAMPPSSAIVTFAGVYCGSLFGGAIASVLFNAPGEACSVATTFDGHPMARDGRAGEALAAAFASSFVGALFAIVLLTLTVPAIARFVLTFGPAEFFALYLLTFCSFIGLGKRSPVKTVAASMVGFALAAVGIDGESGQIRLTFGSTGMMRGFDILVVTIGLFGIGGILQSIEQRAVLRGVPVAVSRRGLLDASGGLPRHWATSLRACVIGCLMGVVPGGATPASFVSYIVARRLSPDGAAFGRGRIEGVVAPETASRAAGTGALVPMLALGVPGSATTVVLFGGLLIWGLPPGPVLFVEHEDAAWGFVAGMYLCIVAAPFLALAGLPLFVSLARIPLAMVVPVTVVMCAIGAYLVHEAVFDIGLMLGCGILGYVLRKLDYPLLPLVFALALGDRVEHAFRQAMLGSQGDVRILFSSPLAGSLSALALTLLLWPLVSRLLKRRVG